MKHVILGAGPAGVVAAETLRRLDPSAGITLIGDEPEPPYSRMAIPYLLSDNIDEAGTHLRRADTHFSELGIEIVAGRAASVDAAAQTVVLDDGGRRAYDKLLVATGSKPIVPPIPGIDHPGVANCWTLQDARKIIAGISPGAPVVLIGAGFIGCIILESLVSAGAELTVIEMGNRMVPRMLDETCGTMLHRWCEQKGVRVLIGATVEAIEPAGGQMKVVVKDGPAVEAGLVISATGVEANGGFLQGCGAQLENKAVVIDDYMASSVRNIYAAGDVACGKDFSTGQLSVQAIQPTAVDHGRVAANNMHRHGAIRHQGSVLMNVLDTMGLISVSYGQWQGVDGGDAGVLVDEPGFRYINLQFEDDRLVGGNALGLTQHVGILRGLIQGRFHLRDWKRRLLDNPLQLMEAYLAVTQG